MRLPYFYGKNGAILDAGSIPELCARHHLPPLLELRLDTQADGYHKIPEGGGTSMVDIRVRIGEGYRLHEKFGPWGDMIAVSADGPFLYFNWIAPLAFSKPTLAADLIPFIRDSGGRLFWIGIKRGRPPGEGKNALIGGIRAIEKRELSCGPTHMLETPLENLIHESGEEVGIALSVLEFQGEWPCANGSVAVTIPELGVVASPVEIRYVDTVRTDTDAERDPSTGELRVHETTGYAFVLRVNRPLSAAKIAAALHPTDEAERTTPFVHQIRSFADVIHIHNSFHSAHHRALFFRSVALYVDEMRYSSEIRTR
jgi:hypothetical protein